MVDNNQNSQYSEFTNKVINNQQRGVYVAVEHFNHY